MVKEKPGSRLDRGGGRPTPARIAPSQGPPPLWSNLWVRGLSPPLADITTAPGGLWRDPPGGPVPPDAPSPHPCVVCALARARETPPPPFMVISVVTKRPPQVDPVEKLAVEMYEAVVFVYMILYTSRRGGTKEGC